MSENSKPLVSVIMPVFNRRQDLVVAIESILDQTVQDFELIIVDDGSTDGSTRVTEEYAKRDRRIILRPHPHNLGLVTALNNALKYARGKYIARMDQDDLSVPNRFQRQVEYMNAHSDVDICGAWMEIIGEPSGTGWRYPEDHDAIYARMFFTSAMAHPTVMMKSEALRAHSLWYDVRAPHAEDYDLWSRALPIVRFANIPEFLLRYRLHATNTGKIHGDSRRLTRIMIYRRLLSRLEIEPSEIDLLLHEKIGLYQYQQDTKFLIQARHWLEQLGLANQRLRLIIPDALDRELSEHWTRICSATSVLPQHTALHILQSSLHYKNVHGLRKIIRSLVFLFSKIIRRFFVKQDRKL